MPVFNDPDYDPNNQPLDPELQAQYDRQEGLRQVYAEQEQKESLENAAEAQQQEDEFSDLGDVVKGGLETALQPVLGVADFASDAIGLVPWLKPVDQWWDDNSYRSTHPGHTLLRDASSIILPTLAGGGWLVGGAKAAVAARAVTLPKFAHTLGTVAAYTGVDTGVAMISSHSKKDDNLAGTLNNWLGWQIPWATRPGDDPDVRWKKNVYEAAGFAGGVELLGAAFTFGRKAKLFPRDAGAEEAIAARSRQLELFDDPLSAAVEPRRAAREAAVRDETVDAIKRDPEGLEYNSFVNDVGDDSAGRAVMDLEADPLQAKLHQTQIQNNTGSYNGRAAPVADEAFQKKFLRAINGDERAKQLDELFQSVSPSFDAIVTSGSKQVKITSEQMNQAVDNLTQAIYGKDLSFKEFEFIVDDMKTTVFNSNQILNAEQYAIGMSAFRKAFAKLFDPNQMRASGMLAQQSADTITDTATAAKLLGEQTNTARQMEVVFDKLNLLGQEVKANEYIMSKAQEYKKLHARGNVQDSVRWLTAQADNFDDYLSKAKAKSNKITDELKSIASENPNYYRAFVEAYDATNGSVDELHKLHRLTEENIGFLKKAFIDKNPEAPSLLVKQLHAARINSILSGLSPVRAAVGNSMLTFAKPISIFAGAIAQGDIGAFKRAQATFGGITENIKRGFKVMKKEWKLASAHPEEAMMRGRVDLRQSKMEHMEYMDSMARGWEAEGELGKLAMWNITKGLTWWNKQAFVRYGTNALYAIDGFTNSFMASGAARARAYDELFDASRGSAPFKEFQDLQRKLYSESFDETGLLTNEAAKHASKEIALNLDSKIAKDFETFLDNVPAAKGLFLFPRTGVNALELGWTFNPMSNLGPAMTKARRVLGAKTKQQKMAALLEHGIDATQDADLAFATLKSEYIGRQIMGSTVVMGAGLWAMEGNLTGNGPQDNAEKRRMMAMGWKPLSIKNPITGQWHSYRGVEPFDKLLGLTADIVYQADRVDQSITEDFFRKAAYSISMNLTNSTFISGFEPLVGLISSDPSSWNYFFARQTDMMIPYKGVRNILNNAITPQIKDVENDFLAHLANGNKFMFSGNEYLKDLMDIYTGEPIRYHDPLTAASNALLPMFQSNGGMEPWRQWLLSTGWDNLQKIRRNKITKMPLTTEDRHFMNNWIAKNGGLKAQVMNMMIEGDGFWQKKMKEYGKARGLKHQKDFPVKEFLVHRELDLIHERAFDGAWDALQARNERYNMVGMETNHRNVELRRGNIKGASETQKRLSELQRVRK